MTLFYKIVVASFLLHLIVITRLHYIEPRPVDTAKSEPVKIEIVEKAQEEVIPPRPPPKKAEKKKKKKPQKKAVAIEDPNLKKPKDNKPAELVRGLSSQSFAEKGQGKKGFVAPQGNAKMIKDEDLGSKLTGSVEQDLSEDAKLIGNSFIKPQYSEEALDYELRGVYLVDVFVNEEGVVREAELRKKIGFSMDERIIAASLKARFIPRKNKYGKSISGWTVIRFKLQPES